MRTCMYFFCWVCVYAPLYMNLYHKVVCSWVSGVLCAIVRPFALSLPGNGHWSGNCVLGRTFPPFNCSSPALLLPRTTPPRTPWPATYPLLITTFPQSTLYSLCPCAPLRRHVIFHQFLMHWVIFLIFYAIIIFRHRKDWKGFLTPFFSHFEVYFFMEVIGGAQ